jgi:hypothetical protein
VDILLGSTGTIYEDRLSGSNGKKPGYVEKTVAGGEVNSAESAPLQRMEQIIFSEWSRT